MKRLLWAALAAAVALPAFAQFKKPEDAVEYRQAAFTVMANHFGRIGAMVNGKAPFDASAAAANAEIVATMSKLPFAAFVEGSEKAGHTHAKPEVWTEPEKFKAAANKMQEEAAKLAAVAKGGNLEQIKAQFGATAQSCKACHDHFREKS